jgi:hypothetical protein
LQHFRRLLARDRQMAGTDRGSIGAHSDLLPHISTSCNRRLLGPTRTMFAT